MKCGISIFEHNKSIFHLGQCHSCYQSNVINEDLEKQIADKEKERLYWQQLAECVGRIIEIIFEKLPMAEAHAVGEDYHNWKQLKDRKP